MYVLWIQWDNCVNVNVNICIRYLIVRCRLRTYLRVGPFCLALICHVLLLWVSL